MSLSKPATLSFFCLLLVVGSFPSSAFERTAPLLSVDGFRPPSSTVAWEGKRTGAFAQPFGYHNPIYADSGDRFSKDPTVLEYEGRYYVYYFGFTPRGRQAIEVASSEDLSHWNYDGVALEARKDGAWDSDLIWAADVVFRDGRFYMYYTGGRLGADGHIDWSSMRIGLATSQDPTGRFVRYERNPVLMPPFGNGVIDADFFADADGKDYLYYVVQSSSGGHWEGIRVRKVEGMVRPGEDERVIEPTAGWEENIVEAPSVFRAKGYYYLLYSGGASESGQKIGYAVSRNPGKGGDWIKYPNNATPEPLVDRGERWADLAVGSTGIVLGPDRLPHIVFQGKSSVDGKFRLGMARLSIGGLGNPTRLVH